MKTPKPPEFTREEKIEWMQEYCGKYGLELELEGTCGFGRPCVGVLVNDLYPDYAWYSADYSRQADKNGRVWTPEHAYHKHECVAVLVTDENTQEAAEDELFNWLWWFESNGFVVETGKLEQRTGLDEIFGQDSYYARMVKKV